MAKRRKINPEWKRWQEACQKKRNQIKRIDESFAPQGQRWKEGQIRHFEKLLTELELQEPPRYL